jgi:hypothetical protein
LVFGLFILAGHSLTGQGPVVPGSTKAKQDGTPTPGQNPSPMVEHTRPHPHLTRQSPPGRREKLTLGVLFVPAALKAEGKVPLFVHFHGGDWLAEVAAARHGKTAVITVQLGSGSAAYARPFTDAKRFARLLEEAQTRAGMTFGPVTLTAWSAGYGAVRAILQVPANYERVQSVLLLDGLHTGYVDGKPGPRESRLQEDGLAIFLRFARAAVAGQKSMAIMHTEIFPGTFASTTETADYLLQKLALKRRAILKWGPLKTQQLSEVRQGRFLLCGFAGNSAPDHVDLLHALPDFLKRVPDGD